MVNVWTLIRMVNVFDTLGFDKNGECMDNLDFDKNGECFGHVGL